MLTDIPPKDAYLIKQVHELVPKLSERKKEKLLTVVETMALMCDAKATEQKTATA